MPKIRKGQIYKIKKDYSLFAHTCICPYRKGRGGSIPWEVFEKSNFFVPSGKVFLALDTPRKGKNLCECLSLNKTFVKALLEEKIVYLVFYPSREENIETSF